MKHLANIKVQLESKDSSHKQTLLQLENNQRTVEELSGLLKSSEIEKEIYLNECKEATVRINELEATVKDMAYQLAESVNLREQISKILSELRATEEQVLRLEIEIAAEKYAKLESMQQVEVVETALSMEKVKTEEFSRQVVELNTTLIDLKLAAAEAEKEKDSLISAKEMELKLAEAAAIETQEKIQSFTKRLEMMRSLENQILDKSMYIEILQNELQETKELHSSSEKVVFDAICEINQLKADLELKEGKNKDQADYIELLETELQELKQEFSTKNEEMNILARNVDEMKEELEKTKSEVTETRTEVTEAEGEIALLKSELHQSKSRIAAAEEKAKSKVTALYAALEQLESEAEETKKENEELKVARKVTKESENYFTPYLHHEDNNQSRRDKHDENQKNDDAEEVRIPKEVYNSLIKMAKQAEELKLGPPEFRTNGTENPKKELEIATSKVAEFRTRAEQAISRAEIAEKGKAELEEKIKKWEEKRAKKRAVLAVLEDEATSKAIVAYRYDDSIQKLTQPLGKILNMQF